MTCCVLYEEKWIFVVVVAMSPCTLSSWHCSQQRRPAPFFIAEVCADVLRVNEIQMLAAHNSYHDAPPDDISGHMLFLVGLSASADDRSLQRLSRRLNLRRVPVSWNQKAAILMECHVFHAGRKLPHLFDEKETRNRDT